MSRIYESVRKHGWATRHTVGVITDIAADIQVRFERTSATFEDQIAVEGIGNPFS